MDETKAEELLIDQSPGSFLVRISSSRAHEGVFVLAVKTSNSGVVQIQIEVSRTLLLDLFPFPVINGTYEHVNRGTCEWRENVASYRRPI